MDVFQFAQVRLHVVEIALPLVLLVQLFLELHEGQLAFAHLVPALACQVVDLFLVVA